METEVIADRERLADYLGGSVLEVMESMVFMAMIPGDSYDPGGGIVKGEVVATLGFTGTNGGIIVASAGQGLAGKIAANMLGIEVEELEDPAEIADAMGEVVNMVAGNVKNHLVEEGWSLELSVPVVNSGKSIEVKLSPELAWGVGRTFVNEEGERFTWEIRFRGNGTA